MALPEAESDSFVEQSRQAEVLVAFNVERFHLCQISGGAVSFHIRYLSPSGLPFC